MGSWARLVAVSIGLLKIAGSGSGGSWSGVIPFTALTCAFNLDDINIVTPNSHAIPIAPSSTRKMINPNNNKTPSPAPEMILTRPSTVQIVGKFTGPFEDPVQVIKGNEVLEGRLGRVYLDIDHCVISARIL